MIVLGILLILIGLAVGYFMPQQPARVAAIGLVIIGLVCVFLGAVGPLDLSDRNGRK